MKKALITGITGQDGAYLAEFLIQQGYQVHGIKRRSSSFNTQRLDHLYQDLHDSQKPNLILHYGDVTDSTNIIRLIAQIQPDEIYHLAAQSHVKVSFETPEYTANADALGTLRILEALRILELAQTTRFYQASTSELYGNSSAKPLDENSAFHPRSPYAVAKLYAYWITRNYREAYSMFACNGILFNHESPERGETFVTRKITRAVAHIKYGLQECLYLGNLNAYRDWGYAKDYVKAMWLMLQQPAPDDFVIATGVAHSVRECVQKAFEYADIAVEWQGHGHQEKGINSRNGKTIVAIDPHYYRPTEVDYLVGNPAKAHRMLGWHPTLDFDGLIRLMVNHDCQQVLKKNNPLSPLRTESSHNIRL